MKPEVRGLVSRGKTKTLNVTSGICNIELIRQKNPRASHEMPVWMRRGSELRKRVERRRAQMWRHNYRSVHTGEKKAASDFLLFGLSLLIFKVTTVKLFRLLKPSKNVDIIMQRQSYSCKCSDFGVASLGGPQKQETASSEADIVQKWSCGAAKCSQTHLKQLKAHYLY